MCEGMLQQGVTLKELQWQTKWREDVPLTQRIIINVVFAKVQHIARETQISLKLTLASPKTLYSIDCSPSSQQRSHIPVI